MAGAKRNFNEAEIKARYLAGEPPSVIAKYYKDCNAQKISSMACRRNWVQEKEETVKALAVEVLNDSRSVLKQLCNKTAKVHLEFIERFMEPDEDGQTMLDKIAAQPFLLDGERHNPLFQTAMNNATKIFLAVYDKLDDGEKKEIEAITVQFEPFMKRSEGDESIPGQEA